MGAATAMERRPPIPQQRAVRPPSLASVAAALAGTKPRGFECCRGSRLTIAGEPLPAAYLITGGLVASLARAPGGARAEAGLIGPGGLVGYAAALGATIATSDAVALTEARGFMIAPATLARLALERPRLGRDLMAYALARFAEVERLCVCAAAHSIEQRLARWLLSAARLADGDPIAITHQQLAELFGVRRASVTTSLHLLEGEQAVRCRRGQVEIRDAARLKAASCGCQ